MKKWLPIFVFPILLIIIIYPFCPGEYDALSFHLSSIAQLLCSLSLFTLVPASIWNYHIWKSDTIEKMDKVNAAYKIYVWTLCAIFLLLIPFIFFGMSKSLSLLFMVLSIWLIKRLLKKSKGAHFLHSKILPINAVLLPVFVLIFVLGFHDGITIYSRNTAIKNATPLIQEIEMYKIKNGRYPLSMNGGWKDYNTGITGIEKYHYSYEDTTYNLYFEQPRFVFSPFGTREFVVYNPTEDHMMLSHASWNLRFTASQKRNNQGWYQGHQCPQNHWKYFWFD